METSRAAGILNESEAPPGAPVRKPYRLVPRTSFLSQQPPDGDQVASSHSCPRTLAPAGRAHISSRPPECPRMWLLPNPPNPPHIHTKTPPSHHTSVPVLSCPLTPRSDHRIPSLSAPLDFGWVGPLMGPTARRPASHDMASIQHRDPCTQPGVPVHTCGGRVDGNGS